MSAKFTLKDHSKEIIDKKDGIVQQILESWGAQAESYAKNNLTKAGRIDTGLLRNSLTYALDGQKPHIESYKANAKRAKGKYKKGEEIPSGTYSGNAPKEEEPSVFIGTNVEYAAYIEAGTDRIKPTHYLKNALTDHIETYKRIAQKALSELK